MTFLIASITPVIIFLYLIYNKDNIKEPPSLLAKCFFGGFLSIVVAILIDTIVKIVFIAPADALGRTSQDERLSTFHRRRLTVDR
mgnify:CR=1 FL=1